MKTMLIGVEENWSEVKAGPDGIGLSARVRIEMGSDLTADPNNRPSRIIVETGAAVADMMAQHLGITPLRAPPRDEFLVRLAAIEDHLRKLVERR
jgi:hypothetical protein